MSENPDTVPGGALDRAHALLTLSRAREVALELEVRALRDEVKRLRAQLAELLPEVKS